MQNDNIVYLSLGSNLGDRLAYLQSAVTKLKSDNNIELMTVSSVYETAPVGYANQGNFLNCCIKIATSLSPTELLDKTSAIEISLKRERHFKNGPRTIDIDLLLYNDISISTPRLTIPHPRMYERTFVLVPLMEIVNGKLHNKILKCLSDVSSEGVILFGKLF